jgi:hypothetical protein
VYFATETWFDRRRTYQDGVKYGFMADKAITNILSYAEMIDKYRITYDSASEDAFGLLYTYRRTRPCVSSVSTTTIMCSNLPKLKLRI